MSYCVLSSNYALAFSHCSKTASCLTARLADDIPIAGMSLGLAEMNRRAEALGLNKPKRTARKSKDGEEPQDSDLETPSKQPKDESTPTPRSTEKDSKPKKRTREEEAQKDTNPKHKKDKKEKGSKHEKKRKETA